jgi:transcriptional regulator with XRE-family HTH domain
MARIAQIARKLPPADRTAPARKQSGRKAEPGRQRSYENRLKELRESRTQLTQRQFARLVGISNSYYGALERGDRPLGEKRARQIAPHLGVPFNELFKRATGMALPIKLIVAAQEREGRRDNFDLAGDEYEGAPKPLAKPEECFVAELDDDSADKLFRKGAMIFVRPIDPAEPTVLPRLQRILVRFLDGELGGDGITREVLFGFVDQNQMGDITLSTVSTNRRIPHNPTIQEGSRRLRGLSERTLSFIPQKPTIEYRARSEDQAVIIGIVELVTG